ncbi:MAG TPA: hypothetical protein VNW46_10635 [Gemmatimonadaceae bacterium]|jgi:hypothetical protein|nr:hypothetical protein [Gemmatimonadaceae bacterium]
MRYLVLLAIGLGVGYGLGFQDAKQNDKNIVARLVDMVGGSTRDKLTTDADAQMDKAETDSTSHKK